MATPERIRERYIDELIGAATVLDSVESAAVAEAWAAGAVAEWLALDGSPGKLAARVDESPLAAQLISWMEGAELAEGEQGWLADVGRHEPTRAVQLRQAGAKDAGVILEYEAPSGDRHDLSVAIDDDGRIVGVAVGPEGLAIAAAEAEREDVTVEELEISAAMDVVRAALARPIGELTPAAEATLPLVIRRIGIGVGHVAARTARPDRTIPARDVEDDRYAAQVVQSATRSELSEEPPPAVVAAMDQFVGRVRADEPDALTVFDIAGLDSAQRVEIDGFIGLVGAYLAPVDLSAHTDPQFDALVELEPADWVGVVLGMSRAVVGTAVDGDALVGFVNKAPEITTTIPKADAPRLAWTFEQTLYAWEVTGVLTGEGTVSDAARWLLPRAALSAWS